MSSGDVRYYYVNVRFVVLIQLNVALSFSGI